METNEDDIIELDGSFDGLLEAMREVFNQFGLDTKYELDDGRYIVGMEIHTTERKVVFLTD